MSSRALNRWRLFAASSLLTLGGLSEGGDAAPVPSAPNVPVPRPAASVPTPGPAPGPALARTPLQGWVDLHTHPLSNLGFAGKLLYGGVDASVDAQGNPNGVMLPADPDCNQTRLQANPPVIVRAATEVQALGHDGSTHSSPPAPNPFNTNCYDATRPWVIHLFQLSLGANDPGGNALGYTGAGMADFADWPKWNDITHQHMWVEWIRRAYNGGLRVMVALALNNRTIADAVAGNGDGPDDDKASADLQISETIGFVGRHPDFMEVAYTSADVDRIVRSNKMAVIIGVEIDHIGNFGHVGVPLPGEIGIRDEIDRLYGAGVRYIFPIHLLDNAFGGTAAYIWQFNVSTLRESGHAWALTCSDPADQISHNFSPGDWGEGSFMQAVLVPKLGPSWIVPPVAPCCGVGFVGSVCPNGVGHKNTLGLSAQGHIAINEMMRLGMLIDIDHMSDISENMALTDAEAIGGVDPLSGQPLSGYPLNSGHSGVRDPTQGASSERSSTVQQYQRIARLHGMAGLGGAKSDAWMWVKQYNAILNAMGPVAPGVAAGFGTDADGIEFGNPPRPAYPFQSCAGGSLCNIPFPAVTYQQGVPPSNCSLNPQFRGCYIPEVASLGCAPGDQTPYHYNQCVNLASTICLQKYPDICKSPGLITGGPLLPPADGFKTWSYNTDGVAHYGMLADFLEDVATLPTPSGGNLSGQQVVANLWQGAEYFYQTWRKAEALSTAVLTTWQPAGWLGWQQVVGVDPGLSPGPTAVKQITVSRNIDGRLEVVYISPLFNNGLFHTWQTTPEVNWWPSNLFPAPLGGSPANQLAMGRNADGRLQIFYTGPNNVIFTNAQLTPGGSWSGEQPLGQGAALQIAVGQNLDGRLEVFVVGIDSRLYHNFQLQPSGSAWSGWNPLNSSQASQLAVARNADGRLEVFYNGPNNTILTNTQVSPGGNSFLHPQWSPGMNWTGESSMAGGALQFSVQQNKVGGLEVFIVGTDHAGWRNVQTGPNGPWGGWASFGGWLSQLATGRNSDGRLEVFCMGVNNALYHNVQTVAASLLLPDGAWSGWQPFSGAAQQIATGVNADGRLEVFVVGTDNLLYHNMQGP